MRSRSAIVTPMGDAVDVAIVGGGPAGAALAIRLASKGISTIVFERTAEPQWRACGVFSSPLTRRRLVELGLSPTQVDELSRPISALTLQTTGGATCRLAYGHGHARGFDRVRLDGALLNRAREAGADVRMSTVVRSVDVAVDASDSVRLYVSPTDAEANGDRSVITARLVVGADGPGSVVARDSAVPERRPMSWKSGITFHQLDPDAAAEGEPMEGRFLIGHGWYVGIAPVPQGRVNVGMVVPWYWLSQMPELVDRQLAAFPHPQARWMSAPRTDNPRVAGMLEHRVRRVSGRRFVLVGDAAGFIDPLTGEGLHRALVSSELAAEAIGRWLRGNANALGDYDRHLRARFRTKDVVSWILQGFIAQPAILDYAVRRLARRHRQMEVLTFVLTDQLPASRALDPRFLARLLAP